MRSQWTQGKCIFCELTAIFYARILKKETRTIRQGGGSEFCLQSSKTYHRKLAKKSKPSCKHFFLPISIIITIESLRSLLYFKPQNKCHFIIILRWYLALCTFVPKSIHIHIVSYVLNWVKF